MLAVFDTRYSALIRTVVSLPLSKHSLHLPFWVVRCDCPDVDNQLSRCSIGLSKRGLRMQPIDYLDLRYVGKSSEILDLLVLW